MNGTTSLEASGSLAANLPKLPGISTLEKKLARYHKMVAPLIETVRDLKGENAMLRAELRSEKAATERRLEALERRLN